MDNFSHNYETATLGGGCFWCLEPAFADLEGVVDAVVGYAGGSLPDPTYEQVTTGRTGHAEVVQVTFDPQVVTFREILEVFFSIHDPTTVNRQGADVGTQYRSIILAHDERQQQVAQEVIAGLERQGIFTRPVVTQVVPFEAFYRAEEYHQEYFEKNPYAGYCQVVIRPKVAKFKKQYADRLKTGA
jgi:peptide-methionine (S)-S-oxide reductase